MKESLIIWTIKLVEILLVALLGIVVCALVSAILNESVLGIVAVAIVFYFFGDLIRPYIKEIQEKLTKNLKKD